MYVSLKNYINVFKVINKISISIFSKSFSKYCIQNIKQTSCHLAFNLLFYILKVCCAWIIFTNNLKLHITKNRPFLLKIAQRCHNYFKSFSFDSFQSCDSGLTKPRMDEGNVAITSFSQSEKVFYLPLYFIIELK